MSRLILIAIAILSFEQAICQADTLKRASITQKAMTISNRMERELSLTPYQSQKISQLMQERLDALNLENQNDPSRFVRVNENMSIKLSQILTKEQFARYIEMKATLKHQKDDFLKKNPNYKFSDEDLELDF